MGVAGISTLREWTRKKRMHQSIELTLFGDKKTFGRGMPYQEDDDTLLLNVPAQTITILPEKEEDFIDWLQEQGEESPRDKHYPRGVFGNYLSERMNGWFDETQAKVVEEIVESVRLLPNGQFEVKSTSVTGIFDAVHLCIGHLPYNDPYELENHPRFIYHPFPAKEKLKVIPKDAKVAILGTGLTAVDMFRYLHTHRPDVRIDFYSRSGRFKSIRGQYEEINYQYFTEENISREKSKHQGTIPLDTYIDWMKKEAEYLGISAERIWANGKRGSKESMIKELNHRDKLGTFQSLLLNMTNQMLPRLWRALKEEDKARFLSDYNKTWDKLRSPLPVKTGEELVQAWEEGAIDIIGGLEKVEVKENTFTLHFKDKSSKEVDYIINATGPDSKITYESTKMPLLKQMMNERLIQAEKFGGVQVSWPTLSAISQKFEVIPRLKVHGELISGVEFGNNSINIISESAAMAVENIFRTMKESK